jgi:hypothetical protein
MDSRLIYGPCSWVKIKHKDQTEFAVHTIDPVKERIEVIVNFVASNGVTQTKYVGCKASQKQKSQLKVGDKVLIEHFGILSSGGLRSPVFCGKV